MGIIDENVASIALNQIKISSFLNVKSVHLEFNNVTLLDVVNVSHVATIETQVWFKKLTFACLFVGDFLL